MIAQGSMLLHELGQALPYPRRRIDLGGHIHLQKFFAAAVTEHADQGVIHFNEASVGRGEEEAFLDVVKQFAIAPLRFTPTRAVRKTPGTVLNTASHGMVNSVPAAVTTRCDFRPQNHSRPWSSR